jgi:hypothetical protein
VWLEIVGRPATETPGYCWLDHVIDKDRERVRTEIAAHWAARRAYAVAFRAQHHSGRIVWVHAGGQPQADGGYRGTVRVARGGLRPMMRVIEVLNRVARCLLIA